MDCKRLVEDAKLPTRKFKDDAGIDVYALENNIIPPNKFKVIRTGVTFEIPYGNVMFVWPKSKANFLIGAGVIDSSYQGEILVKIFNGDDSDLIINKHDPIAQLVLVPVFTPEIEEVSEIHVNKTERGATGGIVNQ